MYFVGRVTLLINLGLFMVLIASGVSLTAADDVIVVQATTLASANQLDYSQNGELGFILLI